MLLRLVCVITLLANVIFNDCIVYAAEAVVRVKCDIDDAIIYVNDKQKGSCPRDIFLEEGDYTISVRATKENSPPLEYVEQLHLAGGDTKRIIAELESEGT